MPQTTLLGTLLAASSILLTRQPATAASPEALLEPGRTYTLTVARDGVTQQASGSVLALTPDWVVMAREVDVRTVRAVPTRIPWPFNRLFKNVGLGRVIEVMWIARAHIASAEPDSQMPPTPIALPAGDSHPPLDAECTIESVEQSERIARDGALTRLSDDAATLDLEYSVAAARPLPILGSLPGIGRYFHQVQARTVRATRDIPCGDILCIRMQLPSSN
jgi:hypothetical protein